MQQYIDSAVEQFRKIITEQLERQNKMEKDEGAKDFANMDKIIIGVCGGDGIGPIISDASVKVMQTLLADEIASGKVEIRNIEGLTVENRRLFPTTYLQSLRLATLSLRAPQQHPKAVHLSRQT